MATVICSRQLLEDLARAVATVRAEDPTAAARLAAAAGASLQVLGLSPLLGRCVAGDLRELIVSSGPAGLVALYRFVVARDEVRVLALRRQRELGFQP